MAEPVFVLGGHQTDFARAWSRNGLDLSDMVRESTLGALEASAVNPSQVQSIHVGNAFGELQRQQAHLGAMVAQVVPELWGVPAMRHEGACASSSLGILAAMAEIEAGRYDCVLVLGVEEFKNTSGDVASVNQNAAAWQGHEGFDCTYMWPAAFGKVAQEYERRYGLDRRYLNRIAELNYGNARRNPLAQTRKWQFDALSFTDDDEANPLIEPGTRRQDCGQITDGACAVYWPRPGSRRSMRFAPADRCRRRHASPAGAIATPVCASWTSSSAAARTPTSFPTCAGRWRTPGAAPASPVSAMSMAWRRMTASPPPNTWPSTTWA